MVIWKSRTLNPCQSSIYLITRIRFPRRSMGKTTAEENLIRSDKKPGLNPGFHQPVQWECLLFYFSCTSIGWQSFVAWFICWRPVNQKKANAERKFERDCKGLCRPANDSVKFSSPALVDQCCEETLKSNKSKKKARQGGQGRCKWVAPPPCSGRFFDCNTLQWKSPHGEERRIMMSKSCTLQ